MKNYAKWKATQCLANYHQHQTWKLLARKEFLDAQLKIIIFDMWKCFPMEIAKHILLSGTHMTCSGNLLDRAAKNEYVGH